MTLKEILQARKRTASAPVEPQPSHTDNQAEVAVAEIPYAFDICPQMSEFYALFEGIENF